MILRISPSPQKYDGSFLAIETTLSITEQDSKLLKNVFQTSYASQMKDLSPWPESPNGSQKSEKQNPTKQWLTHNDGEDGQCLKPLFVSPLSK